jgi:hypothetical protein
VHSGQKAILLFTFFRKHDAGFLQQVAVTPGAKLRLTAWAHAWSNHKDGPHPDDGRWSEGPGYDGGFLLEGEAADSNWQNFTFYVGLDPTGGINPFAGTVVWGQGAHIYNEHAQVPTAEASAQADTVTVFLRSETSWAFKHNDAYWDDAELIVVDDGELEVLLSHRPASPKVGESVMIEARSLTSLADVSLIVRQPSGTELEVGSIAVGLDGDWRVWTAATSPLSEVGVHQVAFSAVGDVQATDTFESVPAPTHRRGLPRVQYERTYVLLPPDASADWALAVVDGAWDQHRYTVGSSADDAGIGDLDARRVIAVNPERWPSDLQAFFEEHYPDVEYVPVEADTPTELRLRLERL